MMNQYRYPYQSVNEKTPADGQIIDLCSEGTCRKGHMRNGLFVPVNNQIEPYEIPRNAWWADWQEIVIEI